MCLHQQTRTGSGLVLGITDWKQHFLAEIGGVHYLTSVPHLAPPFPTYGGSLVGMACPQVVDRGDSLQIWKVVYKFIQ